MIKLYTTLPSILTLVTWVQRTQAWPLANSALRLAFGQTDFYSVQPSLPLEAMTAVRANQESFAIESGPHP